MSANPKERGWGFFLLIGLAAMPLTAILVWAVMFVLNVVFKVPISLDWAFGIVMGAGLVSGPCVVTWLALRQRSHAKSFKHGST